MTNVDTLAAALAGDGFLLFDGAMGTQLQARGLAAGELPELLCLERPEVVTEVHAAYVAAGADVVTTNTFGANAEKLGSAATVEEVFSAAVACARAAGPRYVAADIGPTGQLLAPMGTLPFDDAYELFARQVRAADAAGADLFVIETMADLAEAKAALLAVRENSDLPALVTMTFQEDGRTFLGTTPEVAALTLSSLGAAAVGINCSLGPEEVAPLAARMLPWASCPVMVQANAGLPRVVDGQTVFDIGPGGVRRRRRRHAGRGRHHRGRLLRHHAGAHRGRARAARRPRARAARAARPLCGVRPPGPLRARARPGGGHRRAHQPHGQAEDEGGPALRATTTTCSARPSPRRRPGPRSLTSTPACPRSTSAPSCAGSWTSSRA